MKSVVIIVVILTILTLGVLGYFALRKPTSDELLSRMSQKLSKLSSAHVVIDYGGQVLSGDKEVTTVDLSADGDIDLGDVYRLAFSLSGSLGFVQGQTSNVMHGDLRGIADMFYVRTSELPPLPFPEIDPEPFLEQWISISIQDLDKLRELSTGEEGKAQGSFLKNLDDAKAKELRALVRETKFVVALSEPESDKLNSGSTWHLEVGPNIEEMKNFALESFRIVEEKEMTEDEIQDLDQLLIMLSDWTGEVWVGKWNGNIYRFSAKGPILDDSNEEIGDGSLSIDLSNHNKSVEIEPPEESIGLLELMFQILFQGFTPIGSEEMRDVFDEMPGNSGLIPQGGAQSPGAAHDTDKDGLPDSLETFYGSNPFNPDSDGDGVNDGIEVEQGSNPAGPGALFDFGATQ